MLCQYAGARCVCTRELMWMCAQTDCPTDRPTDGDPARCASMDTAVCRYGDAICACLNDAWDCHRCPDAPPTSDQRCSLDFDGAICPYVGGPTCRCSDQRWTCR
jgi:hypothetical protein